VARAITGGRRWISVREKDLSEGEQIALVRTLLPIAGDLSCTKNGEKVPLRAFPNTAALEGTYQLVINDFNVAERYDFQWTGRGDRHAPIWWSEL
jgi:hypothetical protein